MKQVNGWSRQSRGSSSGYARSSRGRGSQNYSHGRFSRTSGGTGHHYHNHGRAPKPNPFFEMIKERLQYTFQNLAGRKVCLKKANGTILEGILIVSGESTAAGRICTLRYAKVKGITESPLEKVNDASLDLVVHWEDLAYIYSERTNENKPEKSKNLLTLDSSIASRNMSVANSPVRQLKTPDASWLRAPGNSSESPISTMNVHDNSGTWDQFKANEEKFGVKSTFDESLYTTSLDRSSLSKEQINTAERVAFEIEESNRLKNDEKVVDNFVDGDEEDCYAAVSREPVHSDCEKSSVSDTTQTRNIPQRLNFAAAVLKGTHSSKERESFSPRTTISNERNANVNTPFKENLESSHPVAKLAVPNTEKSLPQKGLASRLTVGEVAEKQNIVPASAKLKTNVARFDAWQRRAGKGTGRGEDEEHQRKTIERSVNITREQQIAEFRKFSSDIDRRRHGKNLTHQGNHSKKSLNVNAEEFKPPGEVAPNDGKISNTLDHPTSNRDSSSENTNSQHVNQVTSSKQGPSNNMSVAPSQQVQFPPQQPTMIPLPFGHVPGQPYPVSMIPPVMLNQHPAQGHQPNIGNIPILHPVPGVQHLQNVPGMVTNSMMFQPMAGQPYVVQMMPQFQQLPGQMQSGHPIVQQQFQSNNPRMVFNQLQQNQNSLPRQISGIKPDVNRSLPPEQN